MRELKSERSGRLTDASYDGTRIQAFLPRDLPPEPSLALTTADENLIARANQAIGRLEGIRSVLRDRPGFPDPKLLTYFSVRKEAVLSAQIEGTQSSLSDLLRFESGVMPGVPLDEVEEVSDYIAAMEMGLAALATGKSIDPELISNVHWTLTKSGRGAHLTPGKLRDEQNWVGGASPFDAEYVPPPAALVPDLVESLTRYIRESNAPTLVKAALAHAQFETIHPFFDGNGRLGRLLVTLILQAEQVIMDPLLYLSLYFKQHSSTYYESLQRVRFDGDWEQWLRFFMQGVLEVSGQAVDTASKLLALVDADRARILTELRTSASSALRVLEVLARHPVTTSKQVAEASGVTLPTALSTLAAFQEKGIVAELTGGKKNRLFAYSGYLDVLNRGTELGSLGPRSSTTEGATASPLSDIASPQRG
jgi:Fic family protein